MIYLVVALTVLMLGQMVMNAWSDRRAVIERTRLMNMLLSQTPSEFSMRQRASAVAAAEPESPFVRGPISDVDLDGAIPPRLPLGI